MAASAEHSWGCVPTRRSVPVKGCLVSNSSERPAAVETHAHRRMAMSLVCFGLTLVFAASCSSATTPSGGAPAASQGASQSVAVEPTPSPTPILQPILQPTEAPTKAPTPVPTATPIPAATSAEITAACEGKPIPEADPYTGTLHPLVAVYYQADGDIGWKLAGEEFAYDIYDINHKWLNDEWLSPIQLVVCVGAPAPVKTNTCGTYKRTDGKIGTLMAFRSVVTVRVVVAATGKTLQSKTFNGKSPGCPQHVTTDDLKDNPPWHLIGDPPADSVINDYAVSVSTQKAK